MACPGATAPFQLDQLRQVAVGGKVLPSDGVIWSPLGAGDQSDRGASCRQAAGAVNGARLGRPAQLVIEAQTIARERRGARDGPD